MGLGKCTEKTSRLAKFVALQLHLAFPKGLANAPKKLPAWRSLSPYNCAWHFRMAWQYIKETEIASELSGLFCVCRLCLRSDIPGRPSKAVEKAEKLRFREALPDERTSVLCMIVGLFAMGSAVFGALSPIMAVFLLFSCGCGHRNSAWSSFSEDFLISCDGFNSLSARKCARRRQPQSV